MIEESQPPTQIWIPHPRDEDGWDGPPTEDRFELFEMWRGGLQEIESAPMKPPGGLWTSSYATQEEIGWWDWCTCEMPGWIGTHGYLLSPRPVRVWEIANRDDVEEFHDRYATKDNRFHSIVYVDWVRVCQEVDAVHLHTAWVGKTHLHEHPSRKWGMSLTFTGWDCESTWWARWKFKGRARRVALPERERSG